MAPRKQQGEIARPVSDDVLKSPKASKAYGGGKPAREAVDRTSMKLAHKGKGKHAMLKQESVRVAPNQGPQASSLPTMMGIIDPSTAGRPQNPGIPGLIHSTTLGPEVRQRLVSGIIEAPMGAVSRNEGPVHRVSGHDATAYNDGMVHIPGSPFR